MHSKDVAPARAATPMIEQPSLVVPQSAIPLIFITLAITALFTYFYHYFLPTLLRFLTQRSSRSSIDPTLSSQLATLRRQSNTLNTPATFAEWSKVQRHIQRLEKQHRQQYEQQQSNSSPLLVSTVVYGLLAAVVGLLWWVGRSVVLVEVRDSGWLSWTPVRLLLSEIGVVRWSLICFRVISLLIAPHNMIPLASTR